MKENNIQRLERLSSLLEKGSITKEEFELLRKEIPTITEQPTEESSPPVHNKAHDHDTEPSISVEGSETTKQVDVTKQGDEKHVAPNRYDSFGGSLAFFRILFLFLIFLSVCGVGWSVFFVLTITIQILIKSTDSDIANLVVFFMAHGIGFFCVAYLLFKLVAIVKVIKKREPSIPARIQELLVLSFALLTLHFGTAALWGIVSRYAPDSESPRIEMMKQKLKRFVQYNDQYFQDLFEKYIIYSIQIVGVMVYFRLSKRVSHYYFTRI